MIISTDNINHKNGAFRYYDNPEILKVTVGPDGWVLCTWSTIIFAFENAFLTEKQIDLVQYPGLHVHRCGIEYGTRNRNPGKYHCQSPCLAYGWPDVCIVAF